MNENLYSLSLYLSLSSNSLSLANLSLAPLLVSAIAAVRESHVILYQKLVSPYKIKDNVCSYFFLVRMQITTPVDA
jgi:hypothetical protein